MLRKNSENIVALVMHIFTISVHQKNRSMEDDVLVSNVSAFALQPKQNIYLANKPLNAVMEMVHEKSRIIRQPFIIQAKTKITIISPSLLQNGYLFTVDYFDQTISTEEGGSLVFFAKKEDLEVYAKKH